MSAVLVGELLSVAMFVATVLAVLAGYPVAFTLAGVGLLFAALGIASGVFDVAILSALVGRYFGTMTNETLVAVPLFVFMGVMLERSKIAEALLTTMGELFGSLRGGLGYSVVIVGALLAASTGIVGATVVTMGLLSLPAMMRGGYDPKLAAGTICAAGTLGQIIPPSTVLIFIGDILQGANQRAQLELGNLSPDPISVGQLFAGAMLPGLVLVALYLAWIFAKSVLDPKSCPPLEMTAEQRAGLGGRVLGALAPPLLLILAVLGSILMGVATPTESASVGAVGAMLLAGVKNRFDTRVLHEVMRTTLSITSMVFVILLGASVFSLVFRGLGGENLVHEALGALPGGVFTAVLAVMVVIFVLGFFLDTFEIIFIVVPVAAPALIKMGVDPVWLGVMIGVNLQTSFLTPPFGFALFYLRGVANRLVRTIDVYRGAVPFVALQLAGLTLLWLVPSLATYLPDRLFAAEAQAMESYAPGTATPRASRGSPVADDFRDLFEEPQPGRNEPYYDDLEDLEQR
ncbi:MAG TPA: TRAP transporter large permease subunit [Steroidobacteraceae bacterium]|nr:TRAP transporter large permease subunit [Steroidobacteraceae bacterium]